MTDGKGGRIYHTECSQLSQKGGIETEGDILVYVFSSGFPVTERIQRSLYANEYLLICYHQKGFWRFYVQKFAGPSLTHQIYY
jgi:hypothetical protein